MDMNQHDPYVFAANLPGMTEETAFDLVAAVRRALTLGWEPDGLRKALTAACDPNTTRHPPGAYLRHLNALSAPSPPKGRDGKVVIPPPCSDHEIIPGIPNDLNVRMREDEAGRAYRCPDCHPYARNLRKAAA